MEESLTEVNAHPLPIQYVKEDKIVARNLKEWIHFTTTYGIEFSRLAFAYQMFQTIIVWASVINFLVSSTPDFWERSVLWVEVIERVCVGIFTVDYLIRFITVDSESRFKWVIRPIHIIDLAAIIPFYVEVILDGTNFNPADVSGLVILRALRLFRMIRAFKIARYSTLIPIFMKALAHSKEGFILFSFILAMIMIVLSAVMFYAEQTVMEFDITRRIWLLPDGSVSPYQSIPDTFWWFMVTITTVGYGDTVPSSDLGKFIASIAMVLGLFVLAVPLAVFGSNFTEAWEKRQEKQRIVKLRNIIRNTEEQGELDLVRVMNQRMDHLGLKMEKQKKAHDKLLEEQLELHRLLLILTKKLESRNRVRDDNSESNSRIELEEFDSNEDITHKNDTSINNTDMSE